MRKLVALALVVVAMAATPSFAQTDLGTVSLINGDVDGDNEVTSTDLSRVLKNLGQATADGDLNGDGSVAEEDLSIVLKNLDLVGDE